MNISVDDATRRKRLLWRANHRGIKEMDLILGGYVTRNIETFSRTDLSALEIIMDFPDQVMLAWATKRAPVPKEFTSKLLLTILFPLLPWEKEGPAPPAWEDEGNGRSK